MEPPMVLAPRKSDRGKRRMTMDKQMIVRAWKNPKFRAELGKVLPAHPAGSATVVLGGSEEENYLTSPACTVATCHITTFCC